MTSLQYGVLLLVPLNDQFLNKSLGGRGPGPGAVPSRHPPPPKLPKRPCRRLGALGRQFGLPEPAESGPLRAPQLLLALSCQKCHNLEVPFLRV